MSEFDMSDPPLVITKYIFDELGSEDYSLFSEKIRVHHQSVCGYAAFEPVIEDSRLRDVHRSFRADRENVMRSLPETSKEPDHFKLSGILVFWLRRFAPVIDFRKRNKKYPQNAALAGLLEKHPSELLAFEFGLAICGFFESQKQEAVAPASKEGYAKLGKDNLDYLKTICYMLEFKSISPHSMGMIYRSLYTDPGIFSE